MAEHDLSEHSGGDEAGHAPDAYGFYVMIWLVLLVLTQFTVMAGQFHLGALGKVIAVIVTPAKAVLVLFFFMHLRYEKVLFQVMFIFALVSLITGIGFTFSDYSFR